MVTDLRSGLAPLAGVLITGTFLAVLGPYGSHGFGWPVVWVYWTGLMAIGWTSGGVFSRLLRHVAPQLGGLSTTAILSFAVSLPVTIGVILANGFLGFPVPASSWALVFVMVWVISAAVSALAWLMETRQSAPPEPAGTRIQPGEALRSKLPHNLRDATLLALASEDHYLRVFTEAGDALILMRLSDALVAVEALDGRRTHRSWWVARAAVADVRRGDGRAVLTLSNGVEAPASRTYAPGLREAGWY